MAQFLYKAIVVLPPRSGMPEDQCVNDFYFNSNEASTSVVEDCDEIQSRLLEFYNTVTAPATKSISDFISDSVDRTVNATKTVFYAMDLADIAAGWGSPVVTRSWTIGAADASNAIPNEIAICMSYHGDLTDIPESAVNPTPPPATIRPAARRRGRVYLGPWNLTVVGESADTLDAIPNSTILTTIDAAATQLLTHQAGDLIDWVVWSPTGEVTHYVVGGYIDNAFDVQRRRGTAPTARTAFGV